MAGTFGNRDCRGDRGKLKSNESQDYEEVFSRVSARLRATYDELVAEPLPERLMQLMKRLESHG
jgi:hypothetical protein